MKKHLATVLAALGIAFVLWFGSGFLLTPQTMASGFGLPDWPTEQGTVSRGSRASATWASR
ncbi:hypothetical protein GCM10020229_04240 [Kitasatospora albolonga]|uniref:hypothetical protein n=1 Tax=Kitasatospora albolonga TaxID=68173 RepID=UPI0031E9DE9C